MVTAGYDPLRDEGLEYVARLRRGSPGHRPSQPRPIHGFALMPAVIPAANDAIVEIAQLIGAALARS